MYQNDLDTEGRYNTFMNNSFPQEALSRNTVSPVALISLTLGAFSIGMTEFVIMGILPNVAADLNVTIPQAGQLITSYALGVALGAPILTALTNRIPQKLLLSLLMIVFVIGNLISAMAPNYTVLLLSRLFTALTHGSFLGVSAVIAANIVRPEKRARAVAMVMAGLTISNIVGVPIGTLIGQQWGWRATFYTVVMMGVISFIGIWILIPKLRQEPAAPLASQFRSLIQPRMLLMFLVGALGCGSLFSVFTYIAPLLQNVSGFTEISVTWILVLFGIGITIGNLVGGKLADWKLVPSLMVIYLGTAVVLGVFAYTVFNPVMALVTVFLWGLLAFAMMPGVQLRSIYFARNAPSLASTMNHSAANLGNASGAFLGGWVITNLGIIHLPWLGAILSFLALVVIWISSRLERKERAVVADISAFAVNHKEAVNK